MASIAKALAGAKVPRSCRERRNFEFCGEMKWYESDTTLIQIDTCECDWLCILYVYIYIYIYMYTYSVSCSTLLFHEKDKCQSCLMIAHSLPNCQALCFEVWISLNICLLCVCYVFVVCLFQHCFSKLFQLEAQGWNLALFFQPAGWSESDLWHEWACYLAAPRHLDTFGLFMKATSISSYFIYTCKFLTQTHTLKQESLTVYKGSKVVCWHEQSESLAWRPRLPGTNMRDLDFSWQSEGLVAMFWLWFLPLVSSCILLLLWHVMASFGFHDKLGSVLGLLGSSAQAGKMELWMSQVRCISRVIFV